MVLGELLAAHSPVSPGQSWGAPRCRGCALEQGGVVEWPCQVIDQECVVVVGSQGWEFAPVWEA